MSSTLSYLSLPSRCIQHLCIPSHSQYSIICHYNNRSIESDVNRKRSVRRWFITYIYISLSLLFRLSVISLPASLTVHLKHPSPSFTATDLYLSKSAHHTSCPLHRNLWVAISFPFLPSLHFFFFPSFLLASSTQYTEAHRQRPPKPKQRVTQETPQKTTQTQEPQSAQRERTTSSEQRQKNTQASQVGFDQVTSTRAMHRLVGDILGSMFYVR